MKTNILLLLAKQFFYIARMNFSYHTIMRILLYTTMMNFTFLYQSNIILVLNTVMQIFQFEMDLEKMLYRYYTVIYSILTRCIMSINIVFPRGAQVIYAPTLHIAWGRFQYALWINYFQGFSRISVISSSCMILSNNVHSMALNIYHFLIENANKISNK